MGYPYHSVRGLEIFSVPLGERPGSISKRNMFSIFCYFQGGAGVCGQEVVEKHIRRIP